MNVVTRYEVDGKLTLQEYMNLPFGSEVVVYGPPPHNFLEGDLIYRVGHDRGYTMRKINPHPIREFFRQ